MKFRMENGTKSGINFYKDEICGEEAPIRILWDCKFLKKEWSELT